MRLLRKEANNIVLFNAQRENGTERTWTGKGLKKLVISELAASGRWCRSFDIERFLSDAFLLLRYSNFSASTLRSVWNRGIIYYHAFWMMGFNDTDLRFVCCYGDSDFWVKEALSFLFRKTLAVWSNLRAANPLKLQLLIDSLIKKQISFTPSLTSTELLHELLVCCEGTVAVDTVLLELLEKATQWAAKKLSRSDAEDMIEFYTYMIEQRRLIAMASSRGDDELDRLCLKPILGSCWNVPFSTIMPLGNVLVNASKNDSSKHKLVCQGILKYSALIILHYEEEAFDAILHFIQSGMIDIENSLYTIDFGIVFISIKTHSRGKMRKFIFNRILHVCKVLICNGARLNPSSTTELPILSAIVVLSSYVKRHPPCLLEFILDCIDRGADPKCVGSSWVTHEDLLGTVCKYYKSDDLSDVIDCLFDGRS